MKLDPTTMTVKAAIELLAPLDDSELSAVYDLELDGKGRRSLLSAITARRDDIREDAEAEEVAPAVVVAKNSVILEYREGTPWAAAAAYSRPGDSS